MKLVPVQKILFEVDGVHYEDVERAVQAELTKFLDPFCYRDMGAGDVAEFLWVKRSDVLRILGELQNQFEAAETLNHNPALISSIFDLEKKDGQSL
jgi:hypothetical protein